ncbi:hypothetical protein [Acidovorax sp. ST3]|jgi:hypothetical protein|uniref:hypothetical protein n=1 Tax=Acidovorax sp. ST3 TaxID=2219062 RepID=UPI000DA67407|nr:hypothetical protein [Acidovorax sp. ST3]
MRPIFTVHAGEYLVASEIESLFPKHRVWIPSKDSGIDLLVTDKSCQKQASIQVKFSKDHLASGKEARATDEIKSGGWWKLDRTKLAESPADLWVLVLCQFNTRKYDYVVISPKELARRYDQIAPGNNTIQSYFWVTRKGKCWETRGLGRDELQAVCGGTFASRQRDFTSFLNVWPFKNDV